MDRQTRPGMSRLARSVTNSCAAPRFSVDGKQDRCRLEDTHLCSRWDGQHHHHAATALFGLPADQVRQRLVGADHQDLRVLHLRVMFQSDDAQTSSTTGTSSAGRGASAHLSIMDSNTHRVPEAPFRRSKRAPGSPRRSPTRDSCCPSRCPSPPSRSHPSRTHRGRGRCRPPAPPP